ncbi:MAG: DNA polymerase/3'-5' exonuclease PolX [Thermodesulfobacteriota bacterium]
MNINNEIARIFSNIGNMLDIAGENPFKVRAYKKASRNISALDNDLKSYSDNNQIESIEGIGKDLAKKIKEYIDTGQIQYYEDLKTKVPEELLDILNIQGIGPKLLTTLYSDFGVKNFEDLENVIDSAELKEAKGVGAKKIKEIKVGIKLFKSYLDKINLGIALPVAQYLKEEIANIQIIADIEIVGDIRRGLETVGSIDLVVSTGKIETAKKSILNFPFVKKVFKNDETFLSFLVDKNIHVNIYFSSKKYFIPSVFIHTGSKSHVETISNLAKNNNIKIDNGNFSSETDLYDSLGLQYIPVELRENEGEIELSSSHGLPELIDIKDIKGDLHTHSTWSDGRSKMENMAEAAKALNYEYIAITDHSLSSRIANGLDVKRLVEKNMALQKIDKKIDGIKIFMGSEVDILPGGELDYPDEVLKDLDMVIASVHSNFKMNRDEMTERITKALSNPYVCALGHPTGRLIGERNPYELDIDEVIDTAKKHGKALEVNSSFMRLDLKDEHVKKALDKGVMLIISTDAHHTDQLQQIKYGITTARRGSAKKGDVINTMKLKELESWFKNFK